MKLAHETPSSQSIIQIVGLNLLIHGISVIDALDLIALRCVMILVFNSCTWGTLGVMLMDTWAKPQYAWC